MDKPESYSGSNSVDEIIAHYGVLGMHWGQRKRENGSYGPTPIITKEKPGKKIKTSGGKLNPASSDARVAAIAKQKARSSTTDSLSTKDLQDLVMRMNLEQQYSRLAPKSTSQKVRKFVADILLNTGKQQASKFANDVTSQQIGNYMTKATVK